MAYKLLVVFQTSGSPGLNGPTPIALHSQVVSFERRGEADEGAKQLEKNFPKSAIYIVVTKLYAD
jgi:hypothetical protein